MKKQTKSLLIIAAISVVLIIAAFFIFRKKPEQEETENQQGAAPSSNAGVSLLPESGYPIMKGVSKRKEVYDMQVRLVNEYGANVGLSGPDGDWGAKTEAATLKHLKKNKFNSYGELITAFAANKPASAGGSTANPTTTVLNWFNQNWF